MLLNTCFFSIDEKVMADDEFTCDLFRFLQLLCEGHNNGEDVICFTSIQEKLYLTQCYTVK